MPNRTFQVLISGQPKPLRLEWKLFWKRMTVFEGPITVGTIPSYKDLKNGCDFKLSDGTPLRVQLKRIGLLPELQVLHSGNPVAGSDAAPENRVKTAVINSIRHRQLGL